MSKRISRARDGGEVVVSPGGGENLRADPNGEVPARLRRGTRLQRREVADGGPALERW